MLFYQVTSRLMDIHHPCTLFYHRTKSFMDHQTLLELEVYIYIFLQLNPWDIHIYILWRTQVCVWLCTFTVCEPLIEEAEAELENWHLPPSSEEVSFISVQSGRYVCNWILSSFFFNVGGYYWCCSTDGFYDVTTTRCGLFRICSVESSSWVTYSPPSPGGHLFLPYESLKDALHAEPLLCAKIGIHCYNLENVMFVTPSFLTKYMVGFFFFNSEIITFLFFFWFCRGLTLNVCVCLK